MTTGRTLSPENRHSWVTSEPPPEGWVRGNQVFVGEFLEVFFYDPAVPYSERKPDGSTDRWIMIAYWAAAAVLAALEKRDV